jgi:hypothetical protein
VGERVGVLGRQGRREKCGAHQRRSAAANEATDAR